MSGEKLKELVDDLTVSHVVYSIEKGTQLPADERVLVERYRTTSPSAAMGFILKERHNFTELTILKLYS